MKKINYILLAGINCLLLQQTIAQTAAADNVPFKSITYREAPAGDTVYGVFEGRSPCEDIIRQFQIAHNPDCPKMKWSLMLFQDAATKQPTRYRLFSVLGELRLTEGRWSVSKGTPFNPEAVVYEIYIDKKPLYLLKGDDNVLFILDEKKNLRVGNEDFSYTLNRVTLVPTKRPE